jgi:hypothetical protein
MIRIDRVLRWKPDILRVLVLGVAVDSCSCIQALACPGPSYEQTIMFNHVPTDVDAQVVAEVTIVYIMPENLLDPSNVPGTTVLDARVDNVIKGQIGRGMLKIVAPLGDCSRGYSVGTRGFVAGELRSDTNGNSELAAISVSVRNANSKRGIAK